MEPIHARQIDPDDPVYICDLCGDGVEEEGDLYCANCANILDRCMVCGVDLERRTRDEMCEAPLCLEHR